MGDPKKNELKPWLKQQFCIPPEGNAEFVYHMEDVLEVYHRPYDPRCPKICMDEGSKQVLAHTRKPIEMEVGQAERMDYEYERKGVCSVFLAMEPETGACQVRVSPRRTKKDWALFLREVLDVSYPTAEKVVLVMDNLNTHTPSSFYETFEPAEARRLTEKLEIHYTRHPWELAEHGRDRTVHCRTAMLVRSVCKHGSTGCSGGRLAA